MLNKQGSGKIDWTDWTWNPVSGCLHGCGYCYMKRMEKRFPGIMVPEYHPDRLNELGSKKLQPGHKVFVGSSGDMWGRWVKKEWISNTLFNIEDRPDVTFQFLTKNPGRYGMFKSLKNAWYGTTVDGTPATTENIILLNAWAMDAPVRFVSFEPLLMPVYQDLGGLHWIILGADSNRGAKKPPIEWAERLINQARDLNIPVFVKDNYGYPETIKEFPK